jgi:hypothetical protein
VFCPDTFARASASVLTYRKYVPRVSPKPGLGLGANHPASLLRFGERVLARLLTYRKYVPRVSPKPGLGLGANDPASLLRFGERVLARLLTYRKYVPRVSPKPGLGLGANDPASLLRFGERALARLLTYRQYVPRVSPGLGLGAPTARSGILHPKRVQDDTGFTRATTMGKCTHHPASLLRFASGRSSGFPVARLLVGAWVGFGA